MEQRLDDSWLKDLNNWISVGRVCQHWRGVTLHHPGLWNTLQVSLSSGSSRFTGLNLSSIVIERSGAVPLTVYLQLRSYDAVLRGEPRFQAILSQLPRLCDLRADITEASGIWRDLAQLDAATLKTLSVFTRGGRPLFKKWTAAPRLQSLFVDIYTGWREGIFGNLRHFILSRQSFDSRDFLRLLDVLAFNPAIEDLILYGTDLYIEDEQNFERELERAPPVNMPKLTRFMLSNSHQSGHIQLLSTKLILRDGCAQVYEPAGVLRIVARPETFTPQKLSIYSDRVIGADLRSAICIHAYPLSPSMRALSLDSVTELWLCAPPHHGSSLAEWTHAWSTMPNVVKLVVDSPIMPWLRMLDNHCFPSLEELQIRSAWSFDDTHIVKFLRRRTRAGPPIDLLRFVHPMRTGRHDAQDDDLAAAFDAWRQNPEQFARFVSHVIFDNREDVHLDFELPFVCNTPSPVHAFWEPWQTGR